MKTYRSLVSKFAQGPTPLGEVLEKMTKLPREKLIEAAARGAIWLQRGKGKILRERSLKVMVSPADTVSLFYDPKILSMPSLNEAKCLFENEHYGIWVKEAGTVPQGTQAGDHSSLLRYIELQKRKEVYLVHRLDRETKGLMVFAYDSKTAAKLSDLFQKNQVSKLYEAIVLGELPLGSKSTINASLDDKEAITHYEVLSSKEGKSLLSVKIETGRLHQIRRHLDHIGHPVMGDPKYGKGNKNRQGLQLVAKSIGFMDPWDHKLKEWTLENYLSI